MAVRLPVWYGRLVLRVRCGHVRGCGHVGDDGASEYGIQVLVSSVSLYA